jgi:hypothetical protein
MKMPALLSATVLGTVVGTLSAGVPKLNLLNNGALAIRRLHFVG